MPDFVVNEGDTDGGRVVENIDVEGTPDRGLMQKLVAEPLSQVLRRLRTRRRAIPDWGVGMPHVQRVQAAYRCVLDRAAEGDALVQAESLLAGGGSFDDLLRSLVDSAEFQRRLDAHLTAEKAGVAASAPARVRAAYLCLLAREPDAEGLTHWVDFLRGRGRDQGLLLAFVRSAEFGRRLDQAVPKTENPTVGQARAVAQLLGGACAVRPVARKVEPLAEPPIVDASRSMRFATIGNCQALTLGYCLQVLTGCEMPRVHWTRPDLLLVDDEARALVRELFQGYDKVFIQRAYWNVLAEAFAEFRDRIVLFPAFAFAAYHPDVVYVRHKASGAHVFGPCHDYQSSVALLGWQAGLSAAQTVELFNEDVFRRLGFFDAWGPSSTALIEEGKFVDIDLADFIETWKRDGNFMYSMNHPKPFVILDIARILLERLGIDTKRGDLAPYVYDFPSVGAVCPVYPQIGERLGVSGHFTFKLESPELKPDQPLRFMELTEYVEQSFVAFSAFPVDELETDRTGATRYRQLLDELRAKAATGTLATVGTPKTSPPATQLKLAVMGNEQAGGMSRCLQALLGGAMPSVEYVTAERLGDWVAGRTSPDAVFAAHDKVFVQPWIWKSLSTACAAFADKVVLYPSISFAAYHPDLVDIRMRHSDAILEEGPTGKAHSSLVFLAWTAGLTVSETVAIFRRDVFQRLGYLDAWRMSEHALLEQGRAAGLPLEKCLARWKSRGCFMHQPDHPKRFVMADIAAAVLERQGIPMRPFDLTKVVYDRLADRVAWPVYPEIAEVLGATGGHEFKLPLPGVPGFSPIPTLGLREFVERSFATYARYDSDELTCRPLAWPNFVDLLLQLKECATLPPIPAPAVATAPANATGQPPATRALHPYAGLPPHRFWRKAVQETALADIDPIIKTRFRIEPDTKVATAGSCFALNISRRLVQRGYNFLQTEAVPQGVEEAVEGVGGMGLFSARFGYVYSARQLRQLIDRAYGRFSPDERAWTLETGRFVDPFRPRVRPNGFESVAALEESRTKHLAAVRKMFETLDVMVFTLGMTEGWRSRSDGAIFSVAPGVAGGQMDFDRYEWVNCTVAEVDADLQAFVDALLQVNPRARVLLTVSPVPLLATYSDRHIVVGSTYTKAVLRVAAEQIVQRNAFCDYFPGFDLINSNVHRGRYLSEDLRTVTSEGVDHAMRLFFAHYSGDGAATASLGAEMLAEARKSLQEVCDEELLDAAAR